VRGESSPALTDTGGPKTFANLLTHPDAIPHVEETIADLNRLGPQRLLDRAAAAPKRQAATLTPQQQDIVGALGENLKKVKDHRMEGVPDDRIAPAATSRRASRS
jgi:hypothetical protein